MDKKISLIIPIAILPSPILGNHSSEAWIWSWKFHHPNNMQEERSDDDVSEQETSEEEQEQEDQECDEAEKKRSRNKSLIDFRIRVEEAILGNNTSSSSQQDQEQDNLNKEQPSKDILWGVPLLPGKGHQGTDAVLTKFLKAKGYNVHEALSSLQETLKWRADFLPGEDFVDKMDSLWFTNGRDKEGRPLCYSVLEKESRKKILNGTGDHRCQEYLRWMIMCVEKGIHNLDFSPGGVDSIIQIIDLKNAPGTAAKEVKLICKKMVALLNENYPGLVHISLIINVPSWFMTLNSFNLRSITQRRRKSEFVFVKSSKVTETLLKYATASNIPVQYGGLKRDNDTEFSTDDKVLEVSIKANATQQIEIPMNEADVTVTWDVTVVGYEVTYREEFIPDDDCSYRVLLQEKRMGESIRNSFYIREPGKIVVTIMNGTYTKKKAFYRYKKSRPNVPVYLCPVSCALNTAT